MNMLDLPTFALSPAPAETSLRAGAARDRTWTDDEPAAIALSHLPVGGFATIHAVLPANSDVDRHLVMRLIEIGFVPGERVRVVAHGHPGREPVAVRLSAADSGRRSMNGSTFAMRRHEADFIRVVPDVQSRVTNDAANNANSVNRKAPGR
ncbi:MAG: FeoA family protein [Burkholderiaceae bacterium]